MMILIFESRVRDMRYNHVYPINDLIEHETEKGKDCKCPCNPEFKYNFDEDCCLIVHAAMDRREVFEQERLEI